MKKGGETKKMKQKMKEWDGSNPFSEVFNLE